MLKPLEYWGIAAKVGGKREEERGGRNEKSRSPDTHNAAADDKGYTDSSSSFCLGFGMTFVRHIVRQRAIAVTLKGRRLTCFGFFKFRH